MDKRKLEKLRCDVIAFAREKSVVNDPSHDFSHAMRVLRLSELIQGREGGRLEVLIPASLLHDVCIFPKNDSRSSLAPDLSAEVAREFLRSMDQEVEVIDAVVSAIRRCSFSKQLVPENLEQAILMDADRLEATGAIAIMRTFSSGGQMGIPLLVPDDPFAALRAHLPFESSLSLFFERLLRIPDSLHTQTARELAKPRHQFLLSFLQQLSEELGLPQDLRV